MWKTNPTTFQGRYRFHSKYFRGDRKLPFQTTLVGLGHTVPNPYLTIFVITDLNQDGRPDILLFYAQGGATTSQALPLGALINDGTGRFSLGTSLVLPVGVATENAAAVLVGDFNGDGRSDLFVGSIGLDVAPLFPGAQNLLLLATPTGGYANATSNLPQVSDFTESAGMADIDGDGDLDILVMNVFGGTPKTGSLTNPYFLINDGTGHFSRADDRLPTPISTRVGTEKFTAVSFLDVNGDGKPDLFLGTHGDGAENSKILLNNGAGRFSTEIPMPQALLTGQYNINDTLVSDLNGDGRLDLVLAVAVEGYTSGRIQILINDGGGQFSDRTSSYLVDPAMPRFPESIQAIDVNGDGFLDLVVRSGSTRPVYLSDGQGHLVNLPQSYLGLTFTNSRAGAADFNGDGRTDFVVDKGGLGATIMLQILSAQSQFGTAQDDALLGAGLADTLTAGAGADVLFGGDGNDSLSGEDGNDRLVGGAGGDTVSGGASGDTLSDASGSNYLRGDEGDDSIVGGSDFDDANGNMGNDTVSTGAGEDYCVGGKDNDSLSGGADYDLVYGNLGDDTVNGDDGDDIVRGGQGNDVVNGGNGADFVSGDKGDDTMSGGAGADAFHTFGDAGIDRVIDFNLAQGDRVQLDPGTVFTLSQVGADTVINMTGGGQMTLVGIQLSSLTGNWIFGA